jgi:hypothetical protein
MRSRLTLTLGAASAAVAALSLAAGGAAGAAPVPSGTSGTAPVYTTSQAGYVASGRDFRYAQAVITVPTTPCTVASPQRYIALAGAGSYARAGIRCRPVPVSGPASIPLAGYEGFFTIWRQGFAVFTRTISLHTVSPGDGVAFSIYLNQAGNSDQFTASGPGLITAMARDAHGPTYTEAQALADWTLSTPSQPGQPLLVNRRVTQFLQGRFTTLSGDRGTFSGPWLLTPWEITSNGFAPPSGTLISAPSYLWTDGHGPGGLPGDAFGVWLYK